MERRQRRSSDRRTALHLFLESQLATRGARSLRVTTVGGKLIAGVGDDAYADGWVATSTVRVRGGGQDLVVASSGGRMTADIALGLQRIMG